MARPTVTLRNKQKVCDVTIQRMAIYQQCQVVEATNEDNKHFYLFFHKEHYLNFVSASKLPDRSFANKAMTEGMTFDGTHPLVTSLLNGSAYKKQDFNSLFTQLKQRWGHVETALIATYFTPFIKKQKLANFIQSLFYEERRSGKMFSCYRIYTVLEEFAPMHPLLDAFSGDLKFVEFEKRYKQQDQSTLDQDPIYTENAHFAKKHTESSFRELQSLYENQSRHVGQKAITIDYLTHSQSKEDYTNLIEQNPSFKCESFFSDLYEKGLITQPFLDDYLESLLQEQRLEQVISLTQRQEIALTPERTHLLLQMAKQNTEETLSPETWKDLIHFLTKSDLSHTKEALQLAIGSILTDHDLSYVTAWVEPFEGEPQAQGILEKVKEMNTLSEDPSQQRRLGELYYEFHQPNLAIECMSWDMELDAQDPKPVQWLAKLYDEVGNKEEHDAYQQLYVTMMQQQ